MEPEGSTFKNTFTHYSFHLPKYQRRYEWIEDQWEDFWSSILESYGTDSTFYNDVFLGSFVFQQLKTGGLELNVVDGQQRIVTVFLLLSLIRDLNLQNQEMCDDINQLILQNPKLFRKKDINEKIILSEIDSPSFHEIVNGLNNNQYSSDLIYRGYDWFQNKIKFNNTSLDFDRLKYSILNHLKFAQVILDKYEDAGLMFYTLNFGGKDLEKLDVIRHVFFSYMDPSKYHEYHDKYWHPVEMELYQKQSKILDFIKAVMQFQGWISNSSNVVKDLSRNIRNPNKIVQQQNAQEFLRNMHKQWKHYIWLITPEKIPSGFVEEQRRLIRLNFLNHKDSFPIFLKIFDICNYNSNPSKEDKQTFLEILKIIETFYVRNYVCGDIVKIPDSFVKLLKYNSISSPQEYLLKVKEVLGENLPKDEPFKVSLEQSSLYSLGDDKIGKLLLFALDDHLSGGDGGLIWNHKAYSVEHVMPQSLDHWIYDLGPDHERILQQWCHTLGNLTLVLTKDNSKLSNKTFQEKMIIYGKYGYRLFDLIKGLQWGETEIGKRGEFLAQKCLIIWQNFNERIIVENNENKETKKESIILETVIARDDIKCVTFKGKRNSLKNWKELLIFTVQMMEEDNPKKFRNIILDDLENFSEKEKSKFIFVEKANIFVKYTKSTPSTALQCHEFRIKMGWSSDEYLGEGVRKNQETSFPFYFS